MQAGINDIYHCVFIENNQQGAAVHVITSLKVQAWGNKLDSSYQFNMEEFVL